jgi:hypothetical protein
MCRGYDSFFWRYFNCGRYPTEQREIEYYLCNKWQFKDRADDDDGLLPQPSLSPEPNELVA